MYSKSTIIKQLQLIKESLLQQGIQVEGLWLFGSYAKGQHTESSDIDVAIISSTFDENPFVNTRYIQNIPRWNDMEFHFFRPVDFEDNPFLQEIQKHAIAI